jgi:hypothetical protein
MKNFLVVLLSLILLASCKKDDVPSEAARVIQEIQRVTNSNTNVTVRVYNNSLAFRGEAEVLLIEGDYLVLSQERYNLARLVSYRYIPATGTGVKPILQLYF